MPAKKAKKSKRKENRRVKQAQDFLAYLAFRALEWVVISLPLRVVFTLGQGCGWLAWMLAVPYRRLAQRNLRIAFGGEKSDAELRELCQAHFISLGGNLLSSLKIPAMSEAAVAACVEFEGLEHTKNARRGGLGAVYAGSHLGNWEIIPQVPQGMCHMPTATLYQALGNPYLNAHMMRLRSRLSCRLFDRRAGFHAPVRHLRENSVLGVFVDQHAGDGGAWVPFFGRLASTTTLAALFALRTGAPILPVGIFTIGRARWKMVVREPVHSSSATPEALTAAMNQAVEKLIRESPADWFWVHNRWKTPCPNFLLARYKRGIELPAGMAPPQLKRFEILVRAPNWLGDACLALPAVRAIKRGRPDARVTLLTPAKLADFWRRVTEVDAIIEKDSDGKSDTVFAVRKKVKHSGVRYNAAVLLTDSPRSAFEITSCGIGRIVGYRGKWRKRLLDQVVPEREPGPIEHHVNHFLRLAEHLGADVDDPSLLASLHPGSPGGNGGPSTLALCAGAEYGPAKRWPAEKFAAVAREVAAQRNIEWLLVGTAAEKLLGEQIAAGLNGSHRNLIGQTSLVQLMDELAGCRLLLTNDTGTMHLAAVLGVPVVAIFGSTEPAWTGPLGPGHAVIRHHVECSPCFHRQCPRKHDRYRCMEAVTVEEVISAVLHRL
ncbi:MAG: lipopolysaccharide heptosyltransferase II [Verrucomicrobiales bacterium]